MSYTNFVDIKIVLDENEFQVNQPITGEIFVKNNSPIHLDLETIEIKLSLKHQGKGETDEITLDYYFINDYPKISRGQTISSKFSFNPAFNVSFIGKNMTQSILLTTKVDIKKESEKLLRKEKLSDFKLGGYLKGLVSPDFYDETPVLVIKGDTPYKFKKTSGSIKPGIKKAISILFFGFVIVTILSLFIYSTIDMLEVWYTSLSIYIILLGVVYFYKIKPSLAIGKIDYKLTTIDDSFYQTSLRFKKRTRMIQHINCQLIAKEKVTYDNGSSRSTVTKNFYEGPITKVTSTNLHSFKSELPTKSLPISINNNDFEILWYLKLEVLTRGNKRLNGEGLIELDFPIDF
ncbi:conserved protein of unknown function [Tenacibaculum sp. 190130A14a]|uniref:Arrestin-like N-terminal domain-containing protein n=1 Tax=Tenacibaculum polynesiense TaxID=3137857 RepID=A0ABM9PD51_9FLAO